MVPVAPTETLMLLPAVLTTSESPLTPSETSTSFSALSSCSQRPQQQQQEQRKEEQQQQQAPLASPTPSVQAGGVHSVTNMSRLASIRLTSTDSDSTSLSGYRNSTTTSQDYIDSDVTMSPLSPKSPFSPKSPKSPFSPKSPCSPLSPRSPRGSRPCSPSPLASPVRAGNLAYLASRRSSRDSEAGDLAPLNYARFKQRRRSNFLELPNNDIDIMDKISHTRKRYRNSRKIRIRNSTKKRMEGSFQGGPRLQKCY
nr:putative uncharacterized protein DDB_G0291608 [Procambarus clarkii]